MACYSCQCGWREWRASVGCVLACVGWVACQRGYVVGVLAWVTCSFGDVEKLVGNEYCSKLEKEFRVQVITLRTYLIYQGLPWKFEFKVILRWLLEKKKI